MAGLTVAALAGAAAAREIRPEQLELLAPSDVVILGEVHDNPQHHLNQAAAIRAIDPSAVVFEMLDPAQAVIANDRTRVGTALGLEMGWQNGGWPPFESYAPVFEAVGDARIYGMAVPQARVSAAYQRGPGSAFDGDAARFGLDRGLDLDEQDAREDMQMAAHCNALPPPVAAGLVAAQRLRDASFARTILQAVSDTGGPVAVIAGTGHAHTGWGIPAALRRADPSVTVLSIGQIERTDGAAGDDHPFDMWLVTPPVDRDDPCAMLTDRGQNG